MIDSKQAAAAWQTLGATEPYFAVLTNQRFQAAGRPGPSRDEFFQTGENDIARLFEQIGADYPAFKPHRALDFGCGVGRLVLPLARRVSKVVGVDVSTAMLAEARRNVSEAGLSDVVLAASDSPEFQHIGTFDLIHSIIVFQHVPRRAGLAIARQLVDKLNPGGVAALHFVYSIRRTRSWRLAHWARKKIPGVHRVANIVGGHAAGRPLMQMNAYPLTELYTMVHDAGSSRVSSILMEHDGFLGAMLVFQKPL